jgi:hypothetical protein
MTPGTRVVYNFVARNKRTGGSGKTYPAVIEPVSAVFKKDIGSTRALIEVQSKRGLRLAEVCKSKLEVRE